MLIFNISLHALCLFAWSRFVFSLYHSFIRSSASHLQCFIAGFLCHLSAGVSSIILDNPNCKSGLCYRKRYTVSGFRRHLPKLFLLKMYQGFFSLWKKKWQHIKMFSISSSPVSSFFFAFICLVRIYVNVIQCL